MREPFGAIGPPSATARRLVDASVSANTPRRAYAGALGRLDAWLDGRQLDDASLAAYVTELHDAGRASSSASIAVAPVCFRACAMTFRAAVKEGGLMKPVSARAR